MNIAKVIGRVVATKKDSQLVGKPLLIITMYNYAAKEFDKSETKVAVDSVGAGKGEIVLVSEGDSARYYEGSTGGPIDAAIIGIVDEIDIDD